MTKPEMIHPEIIPGFDCLKWKQERQAQILKETEGKTREQILERFRQAGDRAAIRRKNLLNTECQKLRHN